MNLVLLTFGDRIENHYQAMFSILSFMRSDVINRIFVVTDKPDYYQSLHSQISIVDISSQTLQEWQGPHDFFWRIKIKALEAVIEQAPDEDLLYVDSDTFLATSLDSIKDGFARGQTYMHEEEGHLSKLDSKVERNMWKVLQGLTFQRVQITESTSMWNAGTIGLPAAKAKHIIELALNICDDICATPCPRRLVEQFAFSLALSAEQPLDNCRKTIVHYWGNKPAWNKLIETFFLSAYLKNESLSTQLKRIGEIDPYQLPIVQKEKSTKTKFIKFLNKIFKPKMIRYFGESGR